jgi:hypothetical protein
MNRRRFTVGISLWKHEPSAQMPWAKTMLGLVIAFSSFPIRRASVAGRLAAP